MSRKFYEHFRFAMASVGLPAPDTLWGSATTATATLSALLKAGTSIGARATATELLTVAEVGVNAGAGAIVTQGFLVGVSGVMASFYIGACIGSFIYATQQSVQDRFFGAAGRPLFEQARKLGIGVPHQIRVRLNHAESTAYA